MGPTGVVDQVEDGEQVGRPAPGRVSPSSSRSAPIVSMNSQAVSRSNSCSGSSITPMDRRVASTSWSTTHAAHLDHPGVRTNETDDGPHLVDLPLPFGPTSP